MNREMPMSANPFNEHCAEYDAWFDKNALMHESELLTIQKVLPKSGFGLEVGVGTGRFAAPLGVKVGIDPSINALRMARSRRIQVLRGVGEELPFKANSFYYVLLVTTVCFLDNPEKAFKECWRVLREKGVLIVAIIDRESELGRRYEETKHTSIFYRFARFRSVKEVKKMLESSGFEVKEYYQTLFSVNASKKYVEKLRKGFGQGSFVVMRARKIEKE